MRGQGFDQERFKRASIIAVAIRQPLQIAFVADVERSRNQPLPRRCPWPTSRLFSKRRCHLITPARNLITWNRSEQRFDLPEIVGHHILFAGLSISDRAEHNAVEHPVSVAAVEPVKHGFHFDQAGIDRSKPTLDRVPDTAFIHTLWRITLQPACTVNGFLHHGIKLAALLAVEQGLLKPPKVHDLCHSIIERQQGFNWQTAPIGSAKRCLERGRNNDVKSLRLSISRPRFPLALALNRLLRTRAQIDRFEQGVGLIEIFLIDRL